MPRERFELRKEGRDEGHIPNAVTSSLLRAQRTGTKLRTQSLGHPSSPSVAMQPRTPMHPRRSVQGCMNFAGPPFELAIGGLSMSQPTISTELVRRLHNEPPGRLTDYRDSKLPGFVLRARPSGIHSWRVQLPDRRWLTLGRVDEVALKHHPCDASTTMPPHPAIVTHDHRDR